VGHDINYISIAGMLGMIGWPGTPPAIPLNVMADFAGGGMHAAMAVMAALIARSTTGKGQHVDVAMSDGVLYMMATWVRTALAGDGAPRPGTSILNGALPQYNVYETRDGKWISIGSLETKFWENLCRVMECEQWAKKPFDPAALKEAKAHFTARFKTKTRAEWFEILTQVEICAAPVYTLEEALEDPHNQARRMVDTYQHPTQGRVRQVGIGPKFSETPGAIRLAPPKEGEHTGEVLRHMGYSDEKIAELRTARVVE
jgi:crotonobetainyl-CoA:carnitine CoA-transferase CaiB-like acyl-CoA transferase